MKKLLGVFMCLIMTTVLFTGCKEQKTAENNTNKETENKEETGKSDINIVFAQNLGPDELANNLTKEIISEYEEKTGVKVQFESLPPGDYRTWLTTQFSAGEGPDVYTGIVYDAVADYKSGWIYNFGELFEKESTYDPGQPWKETLPDSILERMYITEKEVPGYPSSTSVVRIFCNKDIFDAAGASMPTNWAEFMESCEKIKQSGVIPFGFPNATISDLSWLWFNNSVSSQLDSQIVETLDESGNGYVELGEIAKGVDENKIDFTKPQLQEGFDLMKEFSRYWTSDFNGLDQESAIDMFVRGEVAMVQALSTNLSSIKEIVGDSFEYEVMPVPAITKETSEYAMGKSVILGGQPDIIYSINNSLKDDDVKREAVIDFVQYMSSPEIQERFANEICRIPLATSTSLPDNLSGFIITEEPLRMPYYTGINEKLRNYFQRAGQQYLEGSIDSKELGSIINDSYKEVFKEINEENQWSKENNYGIE